MKTHSMISIAAVLMTTACAGTGASHEPVLSAVPNAQYPADLAECRALAKTRGLWNAETRTQATLGAAIGSLAGAGESGPGNGTEEVLAGAAVGAATGAAVGAAQTRHARQDILLECLKNRGHPVAG